MVSSPTAPQGFFRDAHGKVHPIMDGEHVENESHLLNRLQTNGGFTVHSHTGEEPKTGFSVSPYLDREQIFDGHPSEQDLHNFRTSNDDLLSKPDHYMGGWHDPDSQKTFLDVSIVKHTPQEAEQTAKQFHQMAYYDLGKGETVNVTPKEQIARIQHGKIMRALESEYTKFAKRMERKAKFAGDEAPTGFFRDEHGAVHPIFQGSGSGRNPSASQNEFQSKLTPDERKSTSSYLHGDKQFTNAVARGDSLPKHAPHSSDHYKAQLSNVNSVIDKAPSYSGKIYRNIQNLDKDTFEKLTGAKSITSKSPSRFTKNNMENAGGSTVESKSLASEGGPQKKSKEPDLSILGDPTKNSVVFVADKHNGGDISSMDETPNDQTVMIPQHTAFHVTGVQKSTAGKFAGAQHAVVHISQYGPGESAPPPGDVRLAAPQGFFRDAHGKVHPITGHDDNEKMTKFIERGQNVWDGKTRGEAKNTLVTEIARRMTEDPEATKALEDVKKNPVGYGSASSMYDQANTFIRGWASMAGDNDNPLAVAHHLAVAKEFGLKDSKPFTNDPDVLSQANDMLTKNNGAYEKLYRGFLRAEYGNTQDQLKDAGISHVTLNRGMTWSPSQAPDWAHKLQPRSESDHSSIVPNEDDESRSQDLNLKMQPVTSWTAKPEANMPLGAASVGKGYYESTLGHQYFANLRTQVPRERILSTARTGRGALPEYEVTLLGGPMDVHAIRMDHAKDNKFGVTMSYPNGETDRAMFAKRGPLMTAIGEALMAKNKVKGPIHQVGGQGENLGASLPGQSRPDEKPEGFFHDSQGNVHPYFAGAGGSGTGFDGKSWKGAGTGKAVNPYEREPTAKQTANAQAALKGMGLTPESLRANYENSIAGGTEKESTGGKSWYARSNAYAAALAKHGNMDTSHAAGVIAALSPHNGFVRNLKDAKVVADIVNGRFQGRIVGDPKSPTGHSFKYMLKQPLTHLTITPEDAQKFMSNESKGKKKNRATNPLNVANYNGVETSLHGKDFTGTHDVRELPADVLASFVPHIGGQRDNFTRALLIARGADPGKVLHGNKVRSFYNNNLDPSGDKYNSATIDTHMIQEGRGKGRGGYGQSWVQGVGDVNSKNPIAIADKKQVGKVFSNPALYRIFDNAVKDVSANHGLRAHQAQAVLWNINKDRGLESLGKGHIKQDRGEFAAGSLTTQYDDDEREDGWLPEDPDQMTDAEFQRSVEEDKAAQRFALQVYLKNTGQTYEQAHWQEGDPDPECINEL